MNPSCAWLRYRKTGRIGCRLARHVAIPTEIA
jgi:hypothetical protein